MHRAIYPDSWSFSAARVCTDFFRNFPIFIKYKFDNLFRRKLCQTKGVFLFFLYTKCQFDRLNNTWDTDVWIFWTIRTLSHHFECPDMGNFEKTVFIKWSLRRYDDTMIINREDNHYESLKPFIFVFIWHVFLYRLKKCSCLQITSGIGKKNVKPLFSSNWTSNYLRLI